MKIQQLEYIIAIAQAGSITAAAKNLYQAQPNISIALKELESEIGMQIFWRTPNGMVLTPEGESFLVRAKDIVESMHSLESDYINQSNNNIPLKLASVRSSYIASAVGAWIRKISPENRINVSILEIMTNTVIDYVSNGKADIGVIRVPESQYEMYCEQLENRRILQRKLMNFNMKILTRSDSPLAKYDDIPFDVLKDYIEIVHGDDEISAFGRTFINPDYDNDDDSERNKICVHDGGNKMMLLEMVPNTFMWAAPTGRANMTKPASFVIKKCSYANVDICDIVICKKSKENNRLVKDFMDFIVVFASEMSNRYNMMGEKKIKP